MGLRCANEPDDVQEVLRAVGNSATAASSSFSPEARVELRLSRSGLPAELPDVGLQGGNGCGSSADSVAAVRLFAVCAFRFFSASPEVENDAFFLFVDIRTFFSSLVINRH